MSFASWLKSLTAHAKRVPVRRRGFSPRLETLEDRAVPATVTWINAAGGDWATVANWSDGVINRLPTAADDAVIPDLPGTPLITHNSGTDSILSLTCQEAISFAGGTLTLANASVVNSSLTLSGATLTGAGTLSVNGLLTWTSGTLSGAGITNANGGLDISGVGAKNLNQRTLNNAATATWIGTGNIQGGAGSTINNLAGAMFQIQNDANFVNGFGGVATFANSGTLRKSITSGATILQTIWAFNNAATGVVEVQTGTLNMQFGGVSTGSFTSSPGATLRFGGGTHDLNAGSSVTGTGTVDFSFGTINVNGSYAPTGATTITGGAMNVSGAASAGSLTLATGTLGGAGTMTANGLLTWSGGTMSGAGITNANGGLDINGGNAKNLNQRTLNNAATATWTGAGNIQGGAGSTINNLAGALFQIQTDADFVNGFGGVATFANSGTLRKSITSGATLLQTIWAFNNATTGLVDVQTGTLSMQVGGVSTGSFTTSPGATLQFGGGTHDLNVGSSVTGTGTVDFSAGTTNVNGSYAPTGATTISGATVNVGVVASTGTLTLSNGTLGGSGTMNVNGLLSWSGGTMSGAGVTNANGGLDINGGNAKNLNQRTLNNAATATWTGAGNIQGGQGSTINNLAGALYQFQTDADFVNGFAGVATFANSGILRKSVTTGQTDLSTIWTFTNAAAGVVEVQSGILSLNSGFSNFVGTTLTGGTYIVTGTLRFNLANVVTNAANIVLDGVASAILNTSNGNGLANFASNTATANFTVQNGRAITTPAFSNAGAVTIGAGSSFLTSAGNYTQTAGTTTDLGTLDPVGIVDIQGGVLPGTGVVNSNVTNAGEVNPGTSPGILTINGNYAGAGSGVLNIELNGTTAGTQHDQLRVNGTVNLTNTTLNATRGFASAVTDTFLILDNDGVDAVTGTFNGLAEAGIVTLGGQRFQITYAGGDGNDVVLTHINTAPVLAPIGDRTVDEETLLTFTASATDVDAPPGTFSFSLDAGAPAGASIHPTTGVFTWTPTEAQGPGTFNITVRVSDNGPPVLSGFETITVTVNEVNRDPVLAAIGNRTVNEETPLTFTATATDPDLPANVLTFSLIGAPPGASIHPTTGVFTWTPTEAQGPGSFSVTVRVTDNGSPNLFDEETINITVNEVPDANQPPTITSGNFSVPENSAAVGTVTATDPDTGTTLTYSIIGGADQSRFSINATTGALTFIAAPNFETPTDAGAINVYDVTVQVTDGALPVSQAMTVTVTNVNEAPTITSGNFTVSENTTAAGAVTATDPDAGTTLIYSIIGGADQSRFSINATTGVLSFNAAPNFETPTDVGANNVYDVTVQVTDGALPVSQAITVTVANVNEALTITSGNFTVSENTTAAGAITATDPDAGTTLTYNIIGGADQSRFSINATTGALTFNAAPNFEAPTDVGANNVYDVVVQVTDGAIPVSQAITVTVINVNEAPVVANGDLTTAEDTATTGTLTATDVDSPVLTFSLVNTSNAHGAVIITNASTGAYSFNPAANFNGPASFTFLASDGALNSNVATITITVTAVNDAPVITSDGGGNTATRSIPENTTAVTTVTAIDLDAGASLTNSIVGGADASRFAIDAATGALRFVAAPDFEGPLDANADNVYDVQVRVSDGTLVVTQTIAVQVTDVPEQSAVYIGQGCCDSTSLVVQGTPGADVIRFAPQGSAAVKVYFNGQEYVFATASFTSITAYGDAGNDQILVSGSIAKDACLFGGGGNDLIKGGAGDDILVGGDGCDVVLGGSGRDLLIGGDGSDLLVGDSGDDILIAGTTDFDANGAAICSIMAEWTQRQSYRLRVAHLQNGTGVNGAFRLNDQTVHDDGDVDILIGCAGTDWFFANLDQGTRDWIADWHCGEAYQDID